MFDPSLCSKCQGSTLKFSPSVNPDSSFYTKLRAESGPYTMKQEEVNDLLLACDLDLDHYEAELTRLRLRIMAIEEQTRRLRSYKEKLPSMTAPIRKLPNELLALIFAYVCDWNLLQEFPWTVGKKKSIPTTLTSPVITYLPALVVSSINAKWRTAALSLPELWSKLKLEITSEENAEPADGFVALLDLFISRSREYPLDINLAISGQPQHNAPCILERLGNQSHRWKTFAVADADHPLRRYLHPDSTRSFHQLRHIQIWRETATPDGLGSVFQNTSMLQELRVRSLTGEWHGITHLALLTFPVQLGDILGMCPNLVSLELKERKALDGDQIPSIPLNERQTVNQIHSLKLVCGNTDLSLGILDDVLSNFTLPSLSNLTITTSLSCTQYHREWPSNSLWQSFISRSSCAITTLDLRTYKLGFSDVDVISLLQLLPSLHAFMLARGDRVVKPETSLMLTKLIRSLDCSLRETPIVPKLYTLVIVSYGMNFDDEAFIRMISSRWFIDPATTAVNRLRTVELYFEQREVDQVVYKPLQDLDKMGLMVTVRGLNNTRI